MKLKAVLSVFFLMALATSLLSGCSRPESGQPQPTAPESAKQETAAPQSGEAAQKAPETVIELNYSNFFPATHYHSILAEQWIREIQRRSNQRVKINYFPGGTLAKAPQTYDAVTQGICDIGMSLFAYTPGRFPAGELVDLPHAYPDGWVATQVANDFYDRFRPKELDDTHPLYFHAHGPGVIFTTKKPVRALEDLKGMIIRATGVGAQIMQALGAQGYGASQAEAYELLSKSVVDGSFAPREVLKGWNQAEVVKYVTGCYEVGNTSMMFVVMNNAKWAALPPDLQQVFTEVSSDWKDKHGKVWNYYDDLAMQHFLGLGQDRELIELGQEEMLRWVKTAVEPLIRKYLTEKSAAGLPAADYQKYIEERVAAWRGKSPAPALCREFAEAQVANWKPQK